MPYYPVPVEDRTVETEPADCAKYLPNRGDLPEEIVTLCVAAAYCWVEKYMKAWEDDSLLSIGLPRQKDYHFAKQLNHYLRSTKELMRKWRAAGSPTRIKTDG